MTHDNEVRELVDLGTASLATLGASGYSTDLVREIPALGISDE